MIEVRRSDGQTFLIDNVSWKIPSDGLVGFDYTSLEVTTEPNAFGNGSRVNAKRTPEKDRSVKCIYHGDLYQKADARKVVRNFFNSDYTFQVIVDYMGIKKYCEGELIALSIPTENIYRDLVLQFTVLCVQPFLLSYDDFAENIAEIDGGLEFDFSIPAEGVDMGFRKYAKQIQIINGGDKETYCRAVFKAHDDVVNPSLHNGTKFIKVLDTLKAGDTLVIDLVSKPVKITKNGVNIIGKTDRQSSFTDMMFKVGSNTISYDAEQGDMNLDVELYYNELYTGI